MVTGERQATRIRGLYLETILRQDIAFFDTETTTGEVIGRMSGDTILIQDAMGEKVTLSCVLLLEFKTKVDEHSNVYMHRILTIDMLLNQIWQVGKFIQLVSTFLGGFVIAFVKGWLLTLVLLGCIPLIVLAGGAMATIMSKMASRGQVAYAEAGNVVEQTVGSIRTVSPLV